MNREKNIEIKKALLKMTAGALEKLAVAGMALAIFQGAMQGFVPACLFLVAGYVVTYLEARK